MEDNLKSQVLAFNLDEPISEYGFSTRLASENQWTIGFTEKAILEYKKFMYLAGTADFMVSPSEIVDQVWHLHLIFTQSYTDLCKLLGKKIQHIPSTHNRSDFQKFKKAKENTRKYYNLLFGEQPKEIWESRSMLDTLNLNFKMFTIKGISIQNLILLTSPVWIIIFYFLLLPIYRQIGNPEFVMLYLIGYILIEFGLYVYNIQYLDGLVTVFPANSFIHNLTPSELIFWENQSVNQVIHGHVNHLLVADKIILNNDKTIELTANSQYDSVEELTIGSTIADLGKPTYGQLSKALKDKPVFGNLLKSQEAFYNYFIKSQEFSNVSLVNFCVAYLLLLLGLIRILTGIAYDKPVLFISVIFVMLTIRLVSVVSRPGKLIIRETIPQFYKDKILPMHQDVKSWDWQYFLLGATVLESSFLPLTQSMDNNQESNSGSGGSCGGGGGGCGGGCDGCGGGGCGGCD